MMIGNSTAVVGRRVMPTGFAVDLTDPAELSGIDITRGGSAMWGETGLATAVKYEGSSTPVWCQLGDTCPADGLPWPGGVWLGPAFTNRLSETAHPFTLTAGAGWFNATGTLTTGRLAPDGTNTATKIADTSGAAVQGVWDVVGTDARMSGWVLYDEAPAANSEATFIFSFAQEYILTPPSPFVSEWRRYQTHQNSISVVGAVGSRSTDAAKQGAAVYWALQAVITNGLRDFMLPFCEGASDASVGEMDAACLAKAIKNGRLDLEITMRWMVDRADDLNGAAVYFWSMATPDGECSLRRTTSETFVLKVRGTDVLTVTKNFTQQQGGSEGQPNKIRAVHDPGTGTCAVYQNVNGCCSEFVGGVHGGSAASGDPLAGATAGHFGSLSGSSLFFPMLLEGYECRTSVKALRPKGLQLGDSLVASSGFVAAYGSYVLTQEEAAAGYTIFLIAFGSATIATQKAAFLASVHRGQSYVEWISVQVGVNDIQLGGTSEDVILDLADLIDTIRADHPVTPIILFALTPMPAPFDAVRAEVNAEIMDPDGVIQGVTLRRNGYLALAETAGAWTDVGNEGYGYAAGNVHAGPKTKRLQGAELRECLEGLDLL